MRTKRTREKTKRERRTARAFDDSRPPLEKLYLTSSRDCDRSVTLTRCRCNGASRRTSPNEGRRAMPCAMGSPRVFSPVRPLPEQRALEPGTGGRFAVLLVNRPTREPRGGGGVGEAGARGAFALPTPHVRPSHARSMVSSCSFPPSLRSNGAKTAPATGSAARRAPSRVAPSCGG